MSGTMDESKRNIVIYVVVAIVVLLIIFVVWQLWKRRYGSKIPIAKKYNTRCYNLWGDLEQLKRVGYPQGARNLKFNQINNDTKCGPDFINEYNITR